MVLSCNFDPKESFYNAGFFDYGVQWSYDYHSSIKALENFVNGTDTWTEVKFPVPALLRADPLVSIKFDTKSFDSLVQESKRLNKSADFLLKDLLKVSNIQIVRI